LPPQRALAFLLGLGVGTITKAYAEAEARGLVTGHVGRAASSHPAEASGRPPARRLWTWRETIRRRARPRPVCRRRWAA